jgi:hypothetical protein
MPDRRAGGKYKTLHKAARRQLEMNNHSNLTLAAALALSLSALMSLVANAQTAPNFIRPRTPNEAPAQPKGIGDCSFTGHVHHSLYLVRWSYFSAWVIYFSTAE